MDRLLEETGESLPIQDQELLDGQIAAARMAQNDDVSFNAAWQEGRAMSMDQAVALAQQETPQPPP